MLGLSAPDGWAKSASRRFDIRPVNSPNNRRCDAVTSLRFTLALGSCVDPAGRRRSHRRAPPMRDSRRTASCSPSPPGPAGPITDFTILLRIQKREGGIKRTVGGPRRPPTPPRSTLPARRGAACPVLALLQSSGRRFPPSRTGGSRQGDDRMAERKRKTARLRASLKRKVRKRQERKGRRRRVRGNRKRK